MTTWLESSNTHQDGTPVTRKIKIPEMGEEIWFTDAAYAEVSDDVADILANNIDSISKLASAPSSPGTYYGDANTNTTVQINISDGVFDALTAESIASDAIDTDHTVSNALSATAVTSANPTLQNQKREWSWEGIEWEDKGEAIIDGSASGSNSPDGACYPTVINASEALDNPIDDYYCYWSGHDTPTGVSLSTAPDPWGPWTFHDEVIVGDALGGGHVASPSAVIDPENNRLNLYVHTNDNGQNSYLMTTPLSGDGTSFSEQTKVLDCTFDGSWDEQERSYLAVRRIGSTYWGVYQGRDRPNNAPAIGVAYSIDGEEWHTDSSPAFDNTQYEDYHPQEYVGSAPGLSTIGGVPYIHYGESATADTRALPLADKDRAMFQGGEHVYGAPSWAGAKSNPHDWWNDGEYLYMFYFVSVSSSDLRIGVARAELGGVYQ